MRVQNKSNHARPKQIQSACVDNPRGWRGLMPPRCYGVSTYH